MNLVGSRKVFSPWTLHSPKQNARVNSDLPNHILPESDLILSERHISTNQGENPFTVSETSPVSDTHFQVFVNLAERPRTQN